MPRIKKTTIARRAALVRANEAKAERKAEAEDQIVVHALVPLPHPPMLGWDDLQQHCEEQINLTNFRLEDLPHRGYQPDIKPLFTRYMPIVNVQRICGIKFTDTATTKVGYFEAGTRVNQHYIIQYHNRDGQPVAVTHGHTQLIDVAYAARQALYYTYWTLQKHLAQLAAPYEENKENYKNSPTPLCNDLKYFLKYLKDKRWHPYRIHEANLLTLFQMKALIQRVTNAKVTVGDELISSIGRGLCVLIGISQEDTVKDVEARKLLSIRMFDDSNGKRWQRNVKDENLELLCVSQFTLYNRLKGNKPDFHLAMQGPEASHLYNYLVKRLGEQYSGDKIKDGVFGAMMQVHIQNDGPVTLEIESPRINSDKANENASN